MWGFTNLNFKLNLKVSAFYLEKQTSFIPKKIFFRPYRQDTSKRWRVPSQFSRRFWGRGHGIYIYFSNSHLKIFPSMGLYSLHIIGNVVLNNSANRYLSYKVTLFLLNLVNWNDTNYSIEECLQLLPQICINSSSR